MGVNVLRDEGEVVKGGLEGDEEGDGGAEVEQMEGKEVG